MEFIRSKGGVVYTYPNCQDPAQHRPADYDEYPGMYSDTLCCPCTTAYIFNTWRARGLALAQ